MFFTPLLPDDYLELIDPMWSSREVRGRIESIAHEMADAVTVTIRPAGRWGELLRGGGADRSASAPAPSEPVWLRQPTRRSTG